MSEDLEEIVDVSMNALGHLIEFGTAIVVHLDYASYIIHNELHEDGEMYNLITTRYELDDVEISHFDHGEIITMMDDIDTSIKPKLSIVKND